MLPTLRPPCSRALRGVRRLGAKAALSAAASLLVAALGPLGTAATGQFRAPRAAPEASPSTPATLGPTGKIVDRLGGGSTDEAGPAAAPRIPTAVLAGLLDFPVPGPVPGSTASLAAAHAPHAPRIAAAEGAPRRPARAAPRSEPRRVAAAPLPPARPSGLDAGPAAVAAVSEEPARLLGLRVPGYLRQGTAIVERVAAWTGSLASGSTGQESGL